MQKRMPRRRNPANTYNHTSQAYDHYRYDHTGPKKKPRGKRRKRVSKRTSKVRFVKALGAKNQSFSVYFAIILIFFMGLGAVVAGSNVTIQRNANNAIRNQLREMEMFNSQLVNQIAQARNPEEIEYLARNELGMSEPLAHNIIAVNLAPQRELIYDFTLPPQYELTYSERFIGFLNSMVSFFVGG